MGNQLVWNQRYDIGVDIIDKEHQKLFRILNRLFNFEKQEIQSQWVCREAVRYFKDHALQHFFDEEKYMESIEYAGVEMHKRIHKNFRETTLPALESELELTNYSEDTVDHFFGVCAGWLIGHTLIEDQAIVSGKALKQWENLLPDDEQAVIEHMIAGQLHKMFHLKSKMISNCYGGEKFGDGIYYRLIYKSSENKNCEFLLVFGEQLIISTIGSMIEDTEAKAVNVMLLNATRYTARQFVGHIKEHFTALTDYEVQEEQLLDYEQFKKIFEKNSPKISLLFDTEKGYFAYCMTTEGNFSDSDGISIMAEDDLKKIEGYINQSIEKRAAERAKKKILVADDSEFMLQMLQQLFAGDYEVITATSGLSAFRSVALSRPDLIVVDYEMSVCKENQILEMIRSEKEFAGIPVVVLANKADKVSIQKMEGFEPQGYLSKSLEPNLIKKVIDHFFERKNGSNQ